MALLKVDHHSEVLRFGMTMNVILPEKNISTRIGENGWKKTGGIPVLWLLHGLGGDHTNFCRYTNIERYVSALGIAVVMPNTAQGRYTDMVDGYDFYTYLTEELRNIVYDMFPRLSKAREDNFVAGVSLGGFGAYKMALDKPEHFSASASLSGVMNINALWEQQKDNASYVRGAQLVYGSPQQVTGSINDLVCQMEYRIQEQSILPRFYMECGSNDFMYPINHDFKERFSSLVDLTWYEEPGNHDWAYWDKGLQRMLAWLSLEKQEETHG